MRRLSTIFLLIILIGFCSMPSYAVYKSGIVYSIPIEYKNLSENELKEKADKYFYLANKSEDEVINEDITNALVLYSILQNKNPNVISYSMRLGILYDKIKKDRYAKGNFSRAIAINPISPEPYFYFGEFYYKRQLYRPALKYYKKAFEYSSKANYDLCYKLGDIYEKFGDTKTALKFLNMAALESPNQELDNKIMRIEEYDSINQKYYGK